MPKKYPWLFSVVLLLSLTVEAANIDHQIDAAKARLQNGVDSQQQEVLRASLYDFQLLLSDASPKNRWLINHYIGLNHHRLGLYYHQVINNKKNAKWHYQKGLEALQRSVKQYPFAESYALLSDINGNLIPLSGWWSTIVLGMRSGEYMKKALKMAPNSPRVWLLSGIGKIYTPKIYGGGLKPALQDLLKSIRLFETKPGPNSPLPDWGYDEAYLWKGIVLKKMNRQREAQTAFKKAILINPKNVQASSMVR